MKTKRKGRATYDREADTIGIYFTPERAEYNDSEEIAPGIVLDFDKQGRVIGVELRYVRELLARGSSPDVTEETSLAAASSG